MAAAGDRCSVWPGQSDRAKRQVQRPIKTEPVSPAGVPQTADKGVASSDAKASQADLAKDIEMKDTTPRSEFRPQFAKGALASVANTFSAAHGSEMDAPHIMPAGSWENVATCAAYPWPRSALVARGE